MDRKTLCKQLGTVDTSLGFLLLIVAATLLSLWAVVLQRRGLCRAICGAEDCEPLPPLYPIRHKASAIIVGSLGFFLCLALTTLQEARQGDDWVAEESARTNLWASLLVLLAALLRYRDVDFVECCQRTAAGPEDTLEQLEETV